MAMAKIWATNSHAIRSKVGALIVKDNVIISDGFNGTPHGFSNRCECVKCRLYKNRNECSRYLYDDESCINCQETYLETLPIVIHAECNAITKLAKSTQSSDGSTLYVTLSPCMECAKLIIQAGIKRVVYAEKYHDDEGLELLRQAGIEIEQLQ